MDLKLQRADILQVDSISYANTVKLLPLGKKNKQKLVVGDDSGAIHCYEFTKGEAQSVFTNQVFDGPVSSVSIGGVAPKRDKIFASCDKKIVGINKKGKAFFDLTSTLTEPINSIATDDSKIWTSYEYVHKVYDNGEDAKYFMSPDRINDIVVEYITRDFEYDVVLACQDRCIRILSGTDSTLDIPVSSPVCSVTTLTTRRRNGVDGYDVEAGAAQRSSDLRDNETGIIYGMETGEIGYVQVTRGGKLGKSWCIEDHYEMMESSKVNSIILSDLTKNLIAELVVGRDDGRVEVYCQVATMGMSSPPTKIFSASLGESIRSVQCGMINSSDYSEVIVAVYSGKIVSFTSEAVSKHTQDDSYGRSQMTISSEHRIKSLKTELKQLKNKIDKEKEKLKSMSSGRGDGETLLTKVSNLGAQDFPLRSNFFLDSANAVYRLSIEIQSPLDMVILQSPAMLELKASNPRSIIPSIVPPEYNDANKFFDNVSEVNFCRAKFVAIYSCRNDERKVEISFRPYEGCILGDLSVYVSASCNPKAVKLVKLQLKPLSLHTRVHEPVSEQAPSQCSSISFSGSASIQQSLEWVSQLFPEVPQTLEDNVKEESFRFINCFTKAITTCTISNDQIIVASESFSTLSIVKDTISGNAIQRRLRLQEQLTIKEETASLFLMKLWPQLTHQLSLKKNMELIDSLEEIRIQEGDLSGAWLSPEYQQIQANQESIRADFADRSKAIDYICKIIMDTYVDWLKLEGKKASRDTNEVKRMMSMNDKKGLLSLFRKDSGLHDERS